MEMRFHKACYTGLVMLAGMYGLSRAFSPTKLVALVLLVAGLGIYLFTRGSDEVPAVASLPLLVAALVASWVVGNYAELAAVVDESASSALGDALSSVPAASALVVLGATLSAAGLMKKAPSWLMAVGLATLGLAFVLAVSVVAPDPLTFAEGGREAVVAYLLSSGAMALLVVVSDVSSTRMRLVNRFVMGAFVLMAVVLNVSCQQYVCPLAVSLCSGMPHMPETWFAWWRVVIGVVALLLLSGMMANVDAGGEVTALGPDSSFAFASALGLLLLRVLLSCYFPHSWLLGLAWLACAARTVWLDAERRSVHGRTAVSVLLALSVTLGACVMMLGAGLWPNALVSVLALVALIRWWPKLREASRTGFAPCVAVLSCLAAEAIAWQAVRRFSLEGVAMVLLVLLVSASCLWVLLRPHPSHVRPDQRLVRSVVACAGVVMALSCMPTLSARVSTGSQGAMLALDARGANNRVRDVSYAWYDYHGHLVAQGDLVLSKARLAVESDVLVVTASDARGSQVRALSFFPAWMYELPRGTLEAVGGDEATSGGDGAQPGDESGSEGSLEGDATVPADGEAVPEGGDAS